MSSRQTQSMNQPAPSRIMPSRWDEFFMRIKSVDASISVAGTSGYVASGMA